MPVYMLSEWSTTSKMRALNVITLVAVISAGPFPTFALAGDREVTAGAPLERTKPDYLDKAKGVGPRFKFFSAPPELSSSCALSIRAHVNESDFVDYPTARTLEEFRSKIASSVQLKPNDAERASVHTSFVLGAKIKYPVPRAPT